jgi:hypothetical protein
MIISSDRPHLLLALVVATLWPAVSLASEPADVRKKVQQGAALYEKGDFAGAIRIFSDLYESTAETKYLWDLALAEYDGERAFDAYTHLRTYESKEDAVPRLAEKAREFEQKLQPKLGHVVIRAPAGAEVLVDGTIRGNAPLADAVVVDPDKPHTLAIHSATAEQERQIPAPGITTVEVTLTFPIAAPVVVVPPPPPAGPVTHVERAPLRLWLTIGLGVGAVASGVGAVYLGAKSSSDSTRADQIAAGLSPSACFHTSTTSCSALHSTIVSQENEHVASVFLYVGAGALAAAAAAAWIFLPRDHVVTERAALAPMLGPHVAGLSLTETF